jgi:hypothetical protein
MADLNALIAQGYQFQAPPDPFAQYAKMQQLNVGQNQNALAQYQLAQAQRQDVQANALNQAYASATNPETGEVDYKKVSAALASGGAGSQIPAVLKNQLEYKNARTEGDIKSTELLTKKLAMLPEAYRMADTPEAYLQLHQSVHADPVIGPYLKSVGATPEKGLATLQNAVQTGTFDDLRLKSMQGVSQILESMKPLTVAASSSVYNPKTGTFTQAPAAPEKPAAPPAMVGEYTFAKTPEGGNFKGSYQDFVTARAAAQRAPVQPVAPTVTTIQDPTNLNQMISINARDYRGGGIGSPGVIGLTGKTPAATAKQDVIDKGQAQLSSVLDDLRASYDTLDKSAAIPSTQRGTLSNLAASAQASGIGQALGRMGGTEEQSARDTINSSRMMLLNSIKQATGMSAQQLNSNVELTSWLKAVSDPTQSIETVNNILGNIEKFVASGGKYSAKKEGKTTSAANVAPNLDALLNKYK